jgi:hypothetical protein
MSQSGTFRIQSQAAKALAEWKAVFAEQVTIEAKELAKDSNPPGLITLDHYRKAAKAATRKLEILLQDIDSNDGRQKAA